MSLTETMAQNSADERLEQYLLGELSDEGQREVEERLMTDDEYFRALLGAEDELTDAYVLDSLTPHQRVRFERHFLCTPERREGVRFAAAFRKYLTSENAAEALTASDAVPENRSWLKSLLFWLKAQPPVPRLAACGLALVVVLGISGLIFRVVQLQKEVDQLRSPAAQIDLQELQQQLAVERERTERLSQELKREQVARGILDPESSQTQAQRGEQSGPPERVPVVFVTLSSLRMREGGTTHKVAIPPGTKSVQLLLTLPGNDYQSCHAVLFSEGRELMRWESVAVRRARRDSSITLSLPASLLPPGDFLVRLSAPGTTGELEPIGSYSFRVAK